MLKSPLTSVLKVILFEVTLEIFSLTDWFVNIRIFHEKIATVRC